MGLGTTPRVLRGGSGAARAGKGDSPLPLDSCVPWVLSLSLSLARSLTFHIVNAPQLIEERSKNTKLFELHVKELGKELKEADKRAQRAEVAEKLEQEEIQAGRDSELRELFKLDGEKVGSKTNAQSHTPQAQRLHSTRAQVASDIQTQLSRIGRLSCDW